MFKALSKRICESWSSVLPVTLFVKGVNYNNYWRHGYDHLPLYIDEEGSLEQRFAQVMNDKALQHYCGHVCGDSVHNVAIDELQHHSCMLW